MTMMDDRCRDRGKQGDVKQVFNLGTGKWEFVELIQRQMHDDFKHMENVVFGGMAIEEAADAMTQEFNQFHGWSTGDDQCDNMRTVFNMSRDE